MKYHYPKKRINSLHGRLEAEMLTEVHVTWAL